MNGRKIIHVLVMVVMALSFLLQSSSQVLAKTPPPPPSKTGEGNRKQQQKITYADRKAAADRAQTEGMKLPALGASAMAMGDAPHYFGPYPNYANSPLRLPDALIAFNGDGTGAAASAEVDPATGAITAITVTSGGSGYTTPPQVVISSAVVTTGAGASATAVLSGSVTSLALNNGGANYTGPVTLQFAGDGTGAAGTAVVTPVGFVQAVNLTSGGAGYTTATVEITGGGGSGAAADAVVDASGQVSAMNITNPGTGYTSAPTVNIIGDGAGAAADAVVNTVLGPITSVSLTSGGTGFTAVPAVTVVDAGGTGSGADVSAAISGAVTSVTVNSGGSGYVTPGIRKFMDTLPGLGPTGANNLGQYIPVAQADTTTYPGSDYYEIAVVEYQEQMHTDLPATKLRGYVQLATSVVPGNQVLLFNPDGSPILLPNGSQAVAVDNPHYLGPLISATKDRPVRILFRNLLPTGQGGNLFIPVDTTVMGSGMGPGMGGMAEMDPRNPMCGMLPKPMDCYTENRATLHLHGGISPWISDGTPHQWVTPATEDTPYPKGVSVQNVPDMPDPGPGAMTFFYTNQQSARLMFYHDHSWGITRLNVYAGEAAAYLITDPAEQALINQGILPADQIPMVVQDKTFVPGDAQLALEDPTWDTMRYGGYGQLWVPHVYMPAQNPGDSSGVNQFGRWAYGPWFWPPTNNIDYPPIPNPYYDPNCDPDVQWCEPPLIPGVPYLSMGMEAFNDTPLVNGTAYPVLQVEPKSYRMRILNAANDRFFNFSLYQAVDANGVVCDTGNASPAPEATGVACTEVRLKDVAAAQADPTIFPTPDQTTAGPSWIQIGTEGGFLPSPAVIPPQPITWVTDPTVFNAGNVQDHSLLVGPAERADVVVDFSQFAGQTLILYNDAPAAFPARDPRYDYYTGSADLVDTGGVPTIVAGYGPNTRTVMQIKVAASAPAPAFNLGALQAAFAHHTDGSGVFESSQNPIIVGQGAYNSAYGTRFAYNGANAGLVQIYDERFSFNTLSGQTLNFPLERKAIQDEMGEAFEKEYGRMSGNLGLETPNAQAGTAQNLILYPYVNPASEVIDGIEMAGLSVTPITTTDDGTQIWKITHNGVDTHPIHFHLFDVQLINRVGWDGIIRRPDANELGWKDTVRVSPLEDTIVALRPIIPKIPFGVPDSIRPLNPMMPIGDTSMFNSTDANANPITPPISNQVVNFGWEYVWHCHILSHEEMDMMRPISVNVSRLLPTPPQVTFSRNSTTGAVTLTWADTTPVNYADLSTWGNPANEIGYRIERATIARNGSVGTYSTIGNNLANRTGYVDAAAAVGTNYSYRVVAYNAAGNSASAPVGGAALPRPNAPTNAVATLQAGLKISLTWRDNATNESYFLVEKSVDGGAFTMLAQPNARIATGNVAYTDTAIASGHTYRYRVAAVNSGGASAYATSSIVSVPLPPPAPSNLRGSVARSGNRATASLAWNDNSTGETSFTLQRATNAAFTVGVVNTTVAANRTTLPVTGLYRGVTYYFRIRSNNNGGSSAWSNVFSVVTP